MFEYRNNDPSENIQVEFEDSQGRQRALSFVATCPHWCAEPIIYGDLFAAPLQDVLGGEADPVPRGSAQEAELLQALHDFVFSHVEGVERCRQIISGQLHVGRRGHDLAEAIPLVWFLDALERRSKQPAP